MTLVLTTLAGTSLLACFGFALGLGRTERGGRSRGRLVRPRSSSLRYES